MKMTGEPESQRFESGANRYAAYLETPEGRMRADLAFANLEDFLPRQARAALRALDLGCGTGATGVRLARLGIHVTLLDGSLAMLDMAKHAALEAGVSGRIELRHGDAAQAANLFSEASFDIVLCHNVLEYVEDPSSVLSAAAQVLESDSTGTGILSILARNSPGEVLKAGIQAGDLEAAERNLTSEWGNESLFGGRVRLFTLNGLKVMAKGASLVVVAKRGVRIISDYLPPEVSRCEQYERIFELERKLGRRPEFTAVARYVQIIARHSCVSSGKETGS